MRIVLALLMHRKLRVGRLIHAFGVSQIEENYRFRVIGMFLTLGVIISASTRLIATYI